MIQGIIARFREKGATSPEKAMTAEELGLPPRFEEAMRRRQGGPGIFVEVNGKYYLDEAKLKQLQEEGWAGGAGGRGGWGAMFALRIARMLVGFVAVALALVNILFLRNVGVTLTVVFLLVLWLVLTVFQMVSLSSRRRRWRSSAMGGTATGATV